MSGKKGMKQYPLATKLEAVRLYQEEGKAYKEITKQLQIVDPERVRKWVREFRRRGDTAFGRGPQLRRRGRPPKPKNKDAYIAQLEMENDLLKKFHAELRKLEHAKRNIGSSTTNEDDMQ
ncbi:MAG TPA: helix-turn-helix domain-containing protein [Anaerolineales bacterium]